MSDDEELGFGATEACQAAIGIKCSDCKYYIACQVEDVDECFKDRSD